MSQMTVSLLRSCSAVPWWSQRQVCVNNMPNIVTQKWNRQVETNDLSILNHEPKSTHLNTSHHSVFCYVAVSYNHRQVWFIPVADVR